MGRRVAMESTSSYSDRHVHLAFGKLSAPYRPKSRKCTVDHTQPCPYLPLLAIPTTFEHAKIFLPLLTKTLNLLEG